MIRRKDHIVSMFRLSYCEENNDPCSRAVVAAGGVDQAHAMEKRVKEWTHFWKLGTFKPLKK